MVSDPNPVGTKITGDWSTKSIKAATPPEDLFSLLQCPPGQLVDVIALVAEVSKAEQKTTQHGIREGPGVEKNC